MPSGCERIYSHLPPLAIFLHPFPSQSPGRAQLGRPRNQNPRFPQFRSALSDASRVNSPLPSKLVSPSRRTYPAGSSSRFAQLLYVGYSESNWFSSPLKNKYTRRLKMARAAWPGLPSYKLVDLAKRGNLPDDDTHWALGDSKRALIIFMSAVEEVERVSWTTPSQDFVAEKAKI